MPYVRISLMKPLTGKEAEVLELNSQLVELYRKQKGCLAIHLLKGTTGSPEVGRLGLWESEGAADRAANSMRSMSLRSRLHLLVRRGHEDRSFLAD